MKALKHIFLLTTALVILIPAAISFAHIFSNHTHEVCVNYADEHFHKDNLECELSKFHKNPALELSFIDFETIPEFLPGQSLPNYYDFLSEYQELPFELRGPPAIG